MSTIDEQLSTDALLRIVRAIRFAFIALLIGLSFFCVRSAVLVGWFSIMYTDMLAGKPLPRLTQLLIDHKQFVLVVSFAIPAFGMMLAFDRRIARSFYLLGALMLVALLWMAILHIGFFAPMTTVITGMANPAP